MNLRDLAMYVQKAALSGPTLAGGTRPAAVICPAKKRLNRDAASMTALQVVMTMLTGSKDSSSGYKEAAFAAFLQSHMQAQGGRVLIASDVCHGAQRVVHLGAAAHHTHSQ